MAKEVKCGHPERKYCCKGLCRPCYSKAYREANPEKEKAYNKAYREANPEKEKVRKKAYREANIEAEKDRQKAYRKVKAETVKAQYRAWRKANPEKAKARYHTRRARLAALPHETYDFKIICAVYGNKCAYCGKASKLTVDHLVPVSHPECPGDVPSNIRPACSSCNSSKKDRLFEEWAKENGFDEDTVQFLSEGVDK